MKQAMNKFKGSVNLWLEIIDKMGEYPKRGNTHRYGYKKVREEFSELYSETVQEAMIGQFRYIELMGNLPILKTL